MQNDEGRKIMHLSCALTAPVCSCSNNALTLDPSLLFERPLSPDEAYGLFLKTHQESRLGQPSRASTQCLFDTSDQDLSMLSWSARIFPHKDTKCVIFCRGRPDQEGAATNAVRLQSTCCNIWQLHATSLLTKYPFDSISWIRTGILCVRVKFFSVIEAIRQQSGKDAFSWSIQKCQLINHSPAIYCDKLEISTNF